MVILGGLELVAAGMILHKYNKDKERGDEEEEAARQRRRERRERREDREHKHRHRHDSRPDRPAPPAGLYPPQNFPARAQSAPPQGYPQAWHPRPNYPPAPAVPPVIGAAHSYFNPNWHPQPNNHPPPVLQPRAQPPPPQYKSALQPPTPQLAHAQREPRDYPANMNDQSDSRPTRQSPPQTPYTKPEYPNAPDGRSHSYPVISPPMSSATPAPIAHNAPSIPYPNVAELGGDVPSSYHRQPFAPAYARSVSETSESQFGERPEPPPAYHF